MLVQINRHNPQKPNSLSNFQEHGGILRPRVTMSHGSVGEEATALPGGGTRPLQMQWTSSGHSNSSWRWLSFPAENQAGHAVPSPSRQAGWYKQLTFPSTLPDFPTGTSCVSTAGWEAKQTRACSLSRPSLDKKAGAFEVTERLNGIYFWGERAV